MGAQGGGKWSPSWTQIGPKSKTEKKMRKEALQHRLGEVLGRSWSRLGTILAELEPILGRFGGGWGEQNHCFTLGFSLLFEKYTFRTKMDILAGLGAILGPLGANLGLLGPNLDRFGRPRSQKGGQKGSKRRPRSVHNDISFLIDFWIDFGTTLEAPKGWS